MKQQTFALLILGLFISSPTFSAPSEDPLLAQFHQLGITH